MTTPQPAALPELPEPSLHQGEYGYRLSHEDYYTADQMRARDAMWAERIAALQPQPAAAVSDTEIKRVCDQHGISPRSYVLAFARAILAMRPQAVPMTDEQFEDWWLTLADYNISGRRMHREQAVKFLKAVESHHGITAQGAQGEQG